MDILTDILLLCEEAEGWLRSVHEDYCGYKDGVLYMPDLNRCFRCHPDLALIRKVRDRARELKSKGQVDGRDGGRAVEPHPEAPHPVPPDGRGGGGPHDRPD